MRTQLGARCAVAAAVTIALCALPSLAQTSEWNRGAATDAWNTAGNWTAGVPVPAGTALFNGLGTGNVDLQGGAYTVNALDFGAGDYALLDTGGPAGSLTLATLSQSGGTNAIDALLASGALTGTVSGGEIRLRNTGNLIVGGTWTVGSGTLSPAASGANSGLGAANVTLGGGTLKLLPGPTGTVNGLDERIYDGVPVDVRSNIEGLRATALGPSDAKGVLTTGQLHYNDDNAVSARALALGAVGFNNENFSMLWVGDLKPTVTGQWGLRFNHVDDNASMWVDYNQNGVFELAGSLGNERVYDRGCCAGSGDQVTASLTLGQTYKIGIAMSDTGGGGDLRDFEYRVAGTTTWLDLIPSAAGGIFTTQAIPAAALSNSVNVTANSTIEIGATLPSASLGNLTMGADTRLTVHSPDGQQPLGFTGTTTLSGGTATFNTTGRPSLTLRNVGQTAASNLTASGDGIILLPTTNTYTGLTTIQSGVTVTATANGALGTADAGTVVEPGGSLNLRGGVVYSTLEALTLSGNGHARSVGAMRTGGGNNDFYGPITLAADAAIRNDSNLLRLFGGVNTNGRLFTLSSEGGDVEIQNNGISGTGGVRKEGGNTVTFFQNTDATMTYSGLTEIVAGILDVRGNNSLGSAAGGTVVYNGATLRVRDGRTLGDDITITGLGSGSAGAIRNENNANTLTGTITVNGSSRIHVNDTSLALTGQVTGSAIDKTGTGTLILTNATNNYASVALNGGALRIANTGALGGTTNLSVDKGEALEFDGTMTLNNAAPLTSIAVNSGTLRGISGTTTINTPITVGLLNSVTFDGSGNLIVTQGFGNGGAQIPNILNHYGFRRDTGDAVFYLHNNTGMVNGGSPTTHPTFTGQNILSAGPGGRGLDFNSDQDFMTAVNVPNDNYSNLWIGRLHVTAGGLGTWQFRDADRDDWSGIWFDINNNGVFESSVAGLGTNRGEQMAYNDQGAKSVNITTPGDYLVAFTHLEGGGDSRMEFRFKSPTMASETTVKPADPAQAGIWTPFLPTTPSNDVIKNGTGTVTLLGNNTYDGTTTVAGGTLIAANSQALGTTNGGTIVKMGATLALQGGITIAGETLTLDGAGAAGQLGALASLSGANRFTGAITAQDASPAQIAIGAAGGSSLTLDGDINLRYSKGVFNGPGDVVVNGAISGLGVSGYRNALRHYGYHINNDGVAMDLNNNGGMYNGGNPSGFTSFYGHALLTVGPGSRGLDFNDDNDFINTGAVNQVDNYSNLFVGYLHVDASKTGTWSLRINVQDDPTGIWIDLDRDGVFESSTAGLGSDRGEQLLWNANATTRTVNLTTAGDYLVAFTHREGGGGSQIEAQFQAPGMSALTMIRPADPAQAGIWLTLFNADNSLVKNGTGTTTLAGNNTYNGPTTVNQGTLVVAHNNALGATTAGTTVANDATLAFQGNVSVGAEPLTVGHFTAPGKEGIANLSGANSFAGNIQAASGTGNVGIRSDAGSLTLTGTVALDRSSLTVDGNGDTVIANTITGGALVNNLGFAGAILGTPNLRAYYRLGEAAGAATAIDSGPNGYNGTYEGGAGNNLSAASAYVPLNTALNFDGSDDRVALTNAANLGLNGSFTAMAWIKGDVFSGDKTIFGTDQTGTNLGLHLIARGTQPWMGFYANDTGGVQALSAGTWYLMAWRYDITNGQQAILINGVLDNATTGHAAFQGNDTIRIGRWGGGNYFDGIIDEAAFFNRALSDAEIAALYAAGPVTPGPQTFYSDLVKKGLGTLTLGGNNTYNGTTTVQAGTLLVNGITSGQGSYTVQGGATLGGTGTIGLAPGGGVTFQPGSILSPGLSPGKLTVDGDLALAGVPGDPVTYLWEIGPGGHDEVGVTGELTLEDWKLLVLDDGGATGIGGKYYLFTGFTGLPSGLGNWEIDISQVPLWGTSSPSIYVDDGGVYLSVDIPEPITLGLLALGSLGLLPVLRRRLRRA